MSQSSRSSRSSSSSSSSVTPYLVFLVFVATLGPLQFGFHLVRHFYYSTDCCSTLLLLYCLLTYLQSELNAPQNEITCANQGIVSVFPAPALPPCIPMGDAMFGLVSSSYTLGGLLGALMAGPLSSKYGRLWTLRSTTAFFMLGPVLASTTASIAQFSLGRLLSGVGAGAAIVVGPIFVAEIAPPKARGFFGAFTQVMTNVGILMSQTLGYFLSHDNLWRLILAIAGLIGFVQLLGLTLVPESPVWLADHQRVAQARAILQRIRGPNADIHEETRGWDPAASTTEEETLLTPPPGNLPAKRPAVSMGQVIVDPLYRPAIIAVVAVMLAQQFTGINSIIMYSVSLLSTILPSTAGLLSVMVSGLNVVTTLVCAPLADRLGRRVCLLASIAGMGVNAVLLAVSIAAGWRVLSGAATLLFVGSFAVGLGPVPFILSSELVGPEAVGATQSWALATNWTATFVVAQFFPLLNAWMGSRGQVYWIFAGMAAASGAFIWWWVPETRGKASADEVWGRERRTD